MIPRFLFKAILLCGCLCLIACSSGEEPNAVEATAVSEEPIAEATVAEESVAEVEAVEEVATEEIVEVEPTAVEEEEVVEEEPSFANMEVIAITADEDVAGTYAVAGQNPDGSTYECFLTISPSADTYTWKWWDCGEFDGIGIRLDNIISVVWGAADCGVVAY
jgi:hypothetical protein